VLALKYKIMIYHCYCDIKKETTYNTYVYDYSVFRLLQVNYWPPISLITLDRIIYLYVPLTRTVY